MNKENCALKLVDEIILTKIIIIIIIINKAPQVTGYTSCIHEAIIWIDDFEFPLLKKSSGFYVPYSAIICTLLTK